MKETNKTPRQITEEALEVLTKNYEKVNRANELLSKKNSELFEQVRELKNENLILSKKKIKVSTTISEKYREIMSRPLPLLNPRINHFTGITISSITLNGGEYRTVIRSKEAIPEGADVTVMVTEKTLNRIKPTQKEVMESHEKAYRENKRYRENMDMVDSIDKQLNKIEMPCTLILDAVELANKINNGEK